MALFSKTLHSMSYTCCNVGRSDQKSVDSALLLLIHYNFSRLRWKPTLIIVTGNKKKKVKMVIPGSKKDKGNESVRVCVHRGQGGRSKGGGLTAGSKG